MTASCLLPPASCGLRFRLDGVLGEAEFLVVPGGGWEARSDIGAWGEAHRGAIHTAITLQGERGAIVATVSTGAMPAVYGGLVTGRHAITHHAAIDDLRASGANVVSARVDDGDLISTGGVTSGLDLALWLVGSSASPVLKSPPRSNPISNTSAAAPFGNQRANRLQGQISGAVGSELS